MSGTGQATHLAVMPGGRYLMLPAFPLRKLGVGPADSLSPKAVSGRDGLHRLQAQEHGDGCPAGQSHGSPAFQNLCSQLCLLPCQAVRPLASGDTLPRAASCTWSCWWPWAPMFTRLTRRTRSVTCSPTSTW